MAHVAMTTRSLFATSVPSTPLHNPITGGKGQVWFGGTLGIMKLVCSVGRETSCSVFHTELLFQLPDVIEQW